MNYQHNFEYLVEINVLVSVIFKIAREFNLNNESKLIETDNTGPFWRHRNRFQKNIYMKKGNFNYKTS